MTDEFGEFIEENNNNKTRRSNYNDEKDEITMDEGAKDLRDKVTSINKFLEKYQKRLEGYEYVASLNEVTYTGRVLCGKSCIQKLVSIISPFSENSNLISNGKNEDYYKDKYEINSMINELLLSDQSVYAENYKTILKMSKNTFKRIGSIVLSSRELLRGQFATENQGTTMETDY